MSTLTQPASSESQTTTQPTLEDRVPDVPLDSRLTEGTLAGAVARVVPSNGIAVSATIRVMTSHDLVLVLPPDSQLNTGEAVQFSLYEADKIAARNERGIVHFAHQLGNAQVIGLYSVANLDDVFQHRYFPDRRTEIRFPIHQPAVAACRRGDQDVRILNYSVNGLGVFSRRAISLNQPCQITVESQAGPVSFEATPQWQKKTKLGFTYGCSLDAKHGVVLACRKTHGPSIRQLERLENMADAAAGEQLKEAKNVVDQAERHFSHVRAVTPFLAAFAIGISLQAEGQIHNCALLSGLIGIIASLVFAVLPQTNKRSLIDVEEFAGTQADVKKQRWWSNGPVR